MRPGAPHGEPAPSAPPHRLTRRAFLASPLGKARSNARVPGTGRVALDGEKCSLCGRCAERCPGGAIELAEDEAGVELRFRPEACTACALCREGCPEGALAVERHPDRDPAPVPGSRSTVLARSDRVRCPRCGRLHGSAAEVGILAARVDPRQLRTLRTCPACRSAPIRLRPLAGACRRLPTGPPFAAAPRSRQRTPS